ncbi:hypothetical protein [Photobacterium carnosum]|uniref:hypothetical protein n=1 Tax=Photobacterium carnosum TaxID=2023717 RepID=UPI001E5F2AE0|nr:hypothetical protein [Photobacterium carnosum]MCD9500320.1 hypothetical protein [Photobacterium carnosum]
MNVITVLIPFNGNVNTVLINLRDFIIGQWEIKEEWHSPLYHTTDFNTLYLNFFDDNFFLNILIEVTQDPFILSPCIIFKINDTKTIRDRIIKINRLLYKNKDVLILISFNNGRSWKVLHNEDI